MPDGAHQVEIESVLVSFPFEPYPVQIDYMREVIRSLQRRENALLESPTGTGKTLCLLCATLAWRQSLVSSPLQSNSDAAAIRALFPTRPQTPTEHASPHSPSPSSGAAFPSTPSGSLSAVPTIIYTSRTHAQISQVVRELKRTSYKPRTAVLASRDQLCVNDDLKRKGVSGTLLNQSCNALCSAHRCIYKERYDAATEAEPEEILDIENLVEKCKNAGVCPYYYAHSSSRKTNADITFAPYNYVVDRSIRRSMKCEWRNTIFIVDEAHNFESSCCSSASFSISLMQIAKAVEELESLARAIAAFPQPIDPDSAPPDFTQQGDLDTLKSFFMQLLIHINSIELTNGELTMVSLFTPLTLFQSANSLLLILRKLNLTRESYPSLNMVLQKVISDANTLSTLCAQLNAIHDILDKIYDENSPSDSFASFFKIHIETEKGKRTHSSPQFAENKILHYWCLSPSVAVGELKTLGIYSFLFTSGTLSPLSSYENSMNLRFAHQLENDHIIRSHQLLAAVLTNVSDTVVFNSRYENRQNKAYIRGIGSTILSYLREIPDGVLVFFPTYSLMQECVDEWKRANLYYQMSSIKPLFIEPKDMKLFTQVSKTYLESVEQGQGGLFLGICRGKASEGLDFADGYARAVFIVGIPYPPMKDPQIMLKQQFQDSYKPPPGVPQITGSVWYAQQASRAVNQAIGRVIRHLNDYGCIFLLDERFTYPREKQSLSRWIQPFLKVFRDHSQLHSILNNFFYTAREIAPPPPAASSSLGDSRASASASRSSSGAALDEWEADALLRWPPAAPTLLQVQGVVEVKKVLSSFAAPSQTLSLSSLTSSLSKRGTGMSSSTEQVVLKRPSPPFESFAASDLLPSAKRFVAVSTPSPAPPEDVVGVDEAPAKPVAAKLPTNVSPLALEGKVLLFKKYLSKSYPSFVSLYEELRCETEKKRRMSAFRSILQLFQMNSQYETLMEMLLPLLSEDLRLLLQMKINHHEARRKLDNKSSADRGNSAAAAAANQPKISNFFSSKSATTDSAPVVVYSAPEDDSPAAHSSELVLSVSAMVDCEFCCRSTLSYEAPCHHSFCRSCWMQITGNRCPHCGWPFSASKEKAHLVFR